MPRYAAFLRGVMPTNARMPELVRAFEAAGFTNVRTVLTSGNVVFDARAASSASIERRAEAGMQRLLGRSFLTFVRRTDALAALLEADPFAAFRLPRDAKRVVTFLRGRPPKLSLPIEEHGARILRIEAGEAFGAYVRTPRGPVFMRLIERTLGAENTTRTWETVRKVAAA